MALLFMDTFQSYANAADMTERGWVQIISGAALDTSIYRFGSQSLRLEGSARYRYPISGMGTSVSVGLWFRVDAGIPADKSFLTLFSNVSAFSANVKLLSDGTLSLVNPLSTVWGQSTQKIIPNYWHFLEFKSVMSDSISANDVILKLDDVEIINVPAGTDTKYSTETSYTDILFTGSSDLGKDFHFGGVYVYSPTGGNISSFQGPLEMEWLKPDGNGNHAQFTGSDADSTDNYLHVDEGQPDDDTSYVESSTVGHRDSYTYQNMTGSVGTIIGAQVVSVSKETTATARTLKNFSRVSSTDYDGSNSLSLVNGTYKWLTTLFEDNPNTSSNWTESTLNGAEFGVKVES